MRGNETTAVGGEGVPEGLLSSPASRARNAGGQNLVEKMRAAPDAINRANEVFVDFVREQPLIALGAAIGVGYVLGRMLRRVV